VRGARADSLLAKHSARTPPLMLRDERRAQRRCDDSTRPLRLRVTCDAPFVCLLARPLEPPACLRPFACDRTDDGGLLDDRPGGAVLRVRVHNRRGVASERARSMSSRCATHSAALILSSKGRARAAAIVGVDHRPGCSAIADSIGDVLPGSNESSGRRPSMYSPTSDELS
jgi:hypothetical protein